MSLKSIYKIKRSSYLYTKELPLSIVVVINTPSFSHNVVAMSSQTNKNPLKSQAKPYIK